ncbi:hypothetical protein ACIP5T_12390 [Microbacterium sp. NPDC088619]|uniref:hypothetical protein n=1 Tax=Microbacterium sp. NPDC088619 TaxID=3364196 RepID=UPI003806E6B3
MTYLDGNLKVPHDGTWTVYEEGGAIQGHEWPWARQQDRVAKGMAKALESTYRLGPVGGIWHNESRYRLARVIANDQSFMFKPLDRLTIATAVDALLAGVDDPRDTQFSLNRELLDGADLVDLASWLRSLPDPFLFRSVPAPDQDPQTGWVWSVYSDAQLLRFVAEAYGQACTAYDEARSAAFLDFDWSMGTATPGQFGVVAAVDPGDHTDGLSGSPSLTMSVVPLSVVEAESTRFGDSARFSSNRRSLVVARSSFGPLDDPDAEHDYFMSLAERGSISNLAPFGHRSVVHRVLDLTSHPRPATEIALEWIWDDLQRVKLAHGARPMLR